MNKDIGTTNTLAHLLAQNCETLYKEIVLTLHVKHSSAYSDHYMQKIVP